MRVTSHAKDFPEHAHDAECGSGEHHSHVRVQLAQTFIGLVFVVNSFVTEWLPGFDTNVVGFNAVTGALILGFPIIWVALKDLRAGSFNTNLLVALAVLALFSAGHYQEAGIVSFFMQVGQIIEARTAEGALAVVFGRLSARRIFSGPGHSAGSVLFFCDCRHLSVTRP